MHNCLSRIVCLVLFFPSLAYAQPPQNKDAIANFSLNEDDTTRYDHHYLYEEAYRTIEEMLTDRCPLDLATAIYEVENCFYAGQLRRQEYDAELQRITDGVRAMAQSPGITAPTEDVRLNYCIYLFFTQPCPLNHQQPYQYATESLFGDDGYEGGMLSHLLQTGRGTCRSLPYLYKIVADRIGAKAYIANAPMHAYIRHQSQDGTWWNFETTTGTYSRASFIMDSYHVSEEAIRSGLYMTNLSDKETIVQCLYDLLCIYEHNTGFYSNKFVRKCYTLGLQYHYADNLHRFEINDMKYQLDKDAWNKGLRSAEAIAQDAELQPRYDALQAKREEYRQLGHRPFTPEEYVQKYREALEYMQRHNIPLPEMKKP